MHSFTHSGSAGIPIHLLIGHTALSKKRSHLEHGPSLSCESGDMITITDRLRMLTHNITNVQLSSHEQLQRLHKRLRLLYCKYPSAKGEHRSHLPPVPQENPIANQQTQNARV